MKKNSYNILMFSLFSVYLQVICYTSHVIIANNTGLSLRKRRGERRRGLFESHFFYIMAKKICGIYKITSPSKKVYIGQSVDIERRWREYKRGRSEGQRLLHHSFNKYGVKKHKFEIIARCLLEELNNLETFYIDLYQSTTRGTGLNLISGGGNGYKRSEETLKLMSMANIGLKKEGASSKYIGVKAAPSGWTAAISLTIGKPAKHLGTFDDEVSAAYAYDMAVLKYKNGEFPMNFTKEELASLKNKVKSKRRPTSKYIGVSKENRTNKWAANVYVERETKYLGKYHTEIDAALVVDLFIIKNNLNTKLNLTEEERKTAKQGFKGMATQKGRPIGMEIYRFEDKYFLTKVGVNGKQKYLGIYLNLHEATIVRNTFIIKNKLRKPLNNIMGYEKQLIQSFNEIVL